MSTLMSRGRRSLRRFSERSALRFQSQSFWAAAVNSSAPTGLMR